MRGIINTESEGRNLAKNKKRKSTNDILINALIDLLIGTLLILIEKLID